MKHLITILLMLCALTITSGARAGDDTEKTPMTDLLAIPFQNADGTTETLSLHKGKVIVVVNTASECGFTPQYSDLQKLYTVYGEKGLVVVAFPSNDFGGQEPGSNAEIQEFCAKSFHVSFPVKAKVPVLGDEKAPLFAALTGPESPMPGDIKWNFEKFIIGPDGALLGRFPSRTAPLDKAMLEVIEGALPAGK
jgi:glutathione peroxidase